MVIEKNKIEIIKKIESYGAKYDPDCFGGSAEDQLLACEAVAEATPIKDNYYQKNEGTNENISLNRNGNDIYKRRVNFEPTSSKRQVITELKACSYRTSPKKIASLLEKLFSSCGSKPGHWLYIAQNWPPRPINRVINRMVKLHRTGQKTIQNPAGLFTYLIKKRKRRKSVY